MHLHSTTIPQPRSSHSQTNPNHYSTILRVELETTETTCKNNILFPAAKPRGALETAGVLPAVEVVLSVVNVVFFMTKPLLNRKTARQICRAHFSAPPGNSRLAGLLPDSNVIQRVEIAESPVKCAFCGVCPPSFTYDGIETRQRAFWPPSPHPHENPLLSSAASFAAFHGRARRLCSLHRRHSPPSCHLRLSHDDTE